MRTEELNYNLPAELIVQHPLPVRSDSRLLVLNRSTGDILDSRFSRIGDFIKTGDCLVLNNTKVLPARFFARRKTGGKIEGLFLGQDSQGLWTVYLKGSRKIKTGELFYLKTAQQQKDIAIELVERTQTGQCTLRLVNRSDTIEVLEQVGFPPLPPYIKRGDNPEDAANDRQRYQTVYASQSGAVAAPTAGLHFTEELITSLEKAGVEFAHLTLHTSAGTFLPITAENIEEHKIHTESFSIDQSNAEKINKVRQNGGRIIAVGTTSTRTLETVARQGQVRAAAELTDIFITPGYKFKIVNALITNFHLPKSSLLALVAAFAGLDNVLQAYNHAVKQRYRFYSYGDAMLII